MFLKVVWSDQKHGKEGFPFKNEEVEKFLKVPKLDTTLSQVTIRSDLSEDTGSIRDAMDRKTESLLKKEWDANSSNMVPAFTAICVARNADFWIERLTKHLLQGNKSPEVLDSLSVIGKAVAFLADAADKSVKTSAKPGCPY